MARYKLGDITFANRILRVYTQTGYMHTSGDVLSFRPNAEDDHMEISEGEPVVLTVEQLHKIVCQHFMEMKRDSD